MLDLPRRREPLLEQNCAKQPVCKGCKSLLQVYWPGHSFFIHCKKSSPACCALANSRPAKGTDLSLPRLSLLMHSTRCTEEAGEGRTEGEQQLQQLSSRYLTWLTLVLRYLCTLLPYLCGWELNKPFLKAALASFGPIQEL